MFENMLPMLKSINKTSYVPNKMEELSNDSIVFSTCQTGDTVWGQTTPITCIEPLCAVDGSKTHFSLITIKDKDGNVTHYTIDTNGEKPELVECDYFNWVWNYWVDGWLDYSNSHQILEEMLDRGEMMFATSLVIENDDVERLVLYSSDAATRADRMGTAILCSPSWDAYELYEIGVLSIQLIEKYYDGKFEKRKIDGESHFQILNYEGE